MRPEPKALPNLMLKSTKFEAFQVIVPSRKTFIALPTRFGALQTTSIEAISLGFDRCSWTRACKDAMLNASDPQNKMRSGSVDFVDICRRGYDFLNFTLGENDTMDCLRSSHCMTRTADKSPATRKNLKLEIPYQLEQG